MCSLAAPTSVSPSPATSALADQHRIRVGRGTVGLIAAFLTVKGHCWVRAVAHGSEESIGDVAIKQALTILCDTVASQIVSSMFSPRTSGTTAPPSAPITVAMSLNPLTLLRLSVR
jgi:hypothetical protein